MNNDLINLILLIPAIGLLLPFFVSINQKINSKVKVICFLLLPTSEILLSILTIVNSNNIDIQEHLKLYIFIFLILFGFNFTLILALVKKINHKFHFIIKSITLLFLGFAITFSFLLLM